MAAEETEIRKLVRLLPSSLLVSGECCCRNGPRGPTHVWRGSTRSLGRLVFGGAVMGCASRGSLAWPAPRTRRLTAPASAPSGPGRAQASCQLCPRNRSRCPRAPARALEPHAQIRRDRCLRGDLRPRRPGPDHDQVGEARRDNDELRLRLRHGRPPPVGDEERKSRRELCLRPERQPHRGDARRTVRRHRRLGRPGPAHALRLHDLQLHGRR